MLTRLVILNSETYAKADIVFKDCDSLQIVGPNNIGKSTLIYALNFLYIIDGNKMTFSGNRKGDKATINHYLPSPNQSYIIFEIHKGDRYYTILVKKSVDGKLEYYKIHRAYEESHYFTKVNNSRAELRDFKNLKKNFSANLITIEKIAHKREVFNLVYQKGRNNNGVVWIDKKVSQESSGISNSFSQVYRYLIAPQLITNDSLKDALIISDHCENEHIRFSKKNENDVKRLLKLNKEIRILIDVKKDFLQFKEEVNLCNAIQHKLTELASEFDSNYSLEHSDISTQIIKLDNDIAAHKNELSAQLNPKLSQLNQDVGSINNEIKHKENEQQKLKKEIEEINLLDPLNFLEQHLEKLKSDKKQLERKIDDIQDKSLNSTIINQQIGQVQSEIAQNIKKINNYSNLLIHKLKLDKKDKEIINVILSDYITTLPYNHLNSQISEISELMHIFDGTIKLPDNIKGKEIETVDELKCIPSSKGVF